MAENSAHVGAASGEFLAFRAGGQDFCVDVMSIREIRGWAIATPVPHSPDFVRGVINLRGTVLPILDLAVRLGLPAAEPTARHAIIVTQVGSQVVGLLVEGVSDIITVGLEKIQPTPDVASDMAKNFVKGVIPLDEKLIGMLAIDSVVPQLHQQAA